MGYIDQMKVKRRLSMSLQPPEPVLSPEEEAFLQKLGAEDTSNSSEQAKPEEGEQGPEHKEDKGKERETAIDSGEDKESEAKVAEEKVNAEESKGLERETPEETKRPDEVEKPAEAKEPQQAKESVAPQESPVEATKVKRRQSILGFKSPWSWMRTRSVYGKKVS